MQRVDVAIAGAGIVGLSIALELSGKGFSVLVLERGEPAQEATFAAGGMLAVHDPENPPSLLPLSELSISLYPEYLARIEALSGRRVPYRTSQTLQGDHLSGVESATVPQHAHLRLIPDLHWKLLEEHSLDPRELASALLEANRRSGVSILSHTPVIAAEAVSSGWEIDTVAGTVGAKTLVLATGAWSPVRRLAVTPRKGQMLSLQLPPGVLDQVVRTPEIYLIPRGGGKTVVGATLEDAGFDKVIHSEAIAGLRAKATALLPEVADAPLLDAWAGLRPATADLLPLLGPVEGAPQLLAATGHFRNGILLAPATARLIAQQITGERCTLDPTPYRTDRPTLAHS